MHDGVRGRNISCDLHLEHLNALLKTSIKHAITPDSAQSEFLTGGWGQSAAEVHILIIMSLTMALIFLQGAPDMVVL